MKRKDWIWTPTAQEQFFTLTESLFSPEALTDEEIVLYLDMLLGTCMSFNKMNEKYDIVETYKITKW